MAANVILAVVTGAAVLVGLTLAHFLRRRERATNVFSVGFALFVLGLGVAEVLGAGLIESRWWTILCFVIPAGIGWSYVLRSIVKRLINRSEIARPS